MPLRPTLTQDWLESLAPFAATVGVRLVSAEPGEVRCTLDWSVARTTLGGSLHGGALMTLADVTASLCAFLNVPEGGSTTTIEAKTNFLRAVREGRVEAIARPVHVGRSTVVVQVGVEDAEGRLVALTTQTQAVLPPR